jgi:hypothetical protein
MSDTTKKEVETSPELVYWEVTILCEPYKRDIHDVEQGLIRDGKPFHRRFLVAEPRAATIPEMGEVAGKLALEQAQRSSGGFDKRCICSFHSSHLVKLPFEISKEI